MDFCSVGYQSVSEPAGGAEEHSLEENKRGVRHLNPNVDGTIMCDVNEMNVLVAGSNVQPLLLSCCTAVSLSTQP